MTGLTLDTMKLDEHFDFTYLSLGAGVQSSALLVLACTDDRVPKPDVAIFSDTGDEPQYVMDYLQILKDYAEPFGINIAIAQKGVLSEDALGREKFVPIPLFTLHKDGSKGVLRRQCTREYKITPINKKVREILGYKPRYRVKHKVRAMLGISTDEMQRMKESWMKWTTNTYPLIDLGISRKDCYQIMEEVGLPKPKKSACVYCPYHDDQYWQWMKDEEPIEFARAVDFDEAIRNKTMKGSESPAFVHRSCVPLADAVFSPNDPDQIDFFNNECEGMCGV
tara:strand:- start:79 stop:918 length:840 start_codon:yes stop_codon:yes gene_type:complete